MDETVHEAMYSGHVVQKRKVWHDGQIRVYSNKRVVLEDEDGRLLIEHWLDLRDRVEEGSTVQLDTYLVEVGPVTKRKSIKIADTKPHNGVRIRRRPQIATFSGPHATPRKRQTHSASHYKTLGDPDLEVIEPIQVDLQDVVELVDSATSDPGSVISDTDLETMEQDFELSQIHSPDPDPGLSPIEPSQIGGSVSSTPVVQYFEDTDVVQSTISGTQPSDMELDPEGPDLEFVAMKMRPEPPPGSVEIPLGLPRTGPWTEEAYTLFTWRPPVVKEEPE